MTDYLRTIYRTCEFDKYRFPSVCLPISNSSLPSKKKKKLQITRPTDIKRRLQMETIKTKNNDLFENQNRINETSHECTSYLFTEYHVYSAINFYIHVSYCVVCIFYIKNRFSFRAPVCSQWAYVCLD